MVDRDYDFDIRLTTDVTNAIEQANLTAHATRRRLSPLDKLPVLNFLVRFVEQEIQGSRREGEPVAVTLAALRELETVLWFLVKSGHMEFLPYLQTIESGMARVARSAREQLVKSFLSPSTPPDELEEISLGLIELIECGAWPNWKEEFNAAVEACRPQS